MSTTKIPIMILSPSSAFVTPDRTPGQFRLHVERDGDRFAYLMDREGLVALRVAIARALDEAEAK